MQCRVCRSNCEETTDMSYVVPTDGKTLYDYFNDCTQLKATAEDDLPKILCMNCTQNLQQAYNFRQNARRSDKELKSVLLLAKNQGNLVSDSAGNQTEILEDIDESTFLCHPEISNILQDIGTIALHSASTINDPAIIRDPAKQSQILEDINISSPIDPLSEVTPLTVCHEVLHELNIVKGEIKLELSSYKFDNSNDDHFMESMHVGEDENSDNHELKPKITCYACDYCTYKCRMQAQLKDHIFELHKDAIMCGKCCKVFELPKELKLHNKLLHDIASHMSCPWCKNSSPMPKKELAKHLQTKHNDTFLKYFPRVHILRRGENEPYLCERCKKSFTSMYELADHLQEEHAYNCPLCGKSVKRKHAYKTHLRRVHNHSITSLKTMLSENRNKQTINNKHKATKSQSVINPEGQQSPLDNTSDHQTYVEDEEETETDEEEMNENDDFFKCPKNTTNRKEKREKRLEEGPKKYICAYCPREFVRQKNVRLHERKIHLRETTEHEKCPICEKELNPNYLKTHIANVHNADRNLACEICGDLFKTTKLLHNHKQLHIDRKHPCTVCNKKFICASELRVHMRMHTGEEPFQCHICEQRFKIRGALNYHLQRHAGIKRKCEVCGKEFNRIEKLKNHTYTHTGMPYRCHLCDFQTVKRLGLKKHLPEKHGINITDDELFAMFKANTGRCPRVRVVNTPPEINTGR